MLFLALCTAAGCGNKDGAPADSSGGVTLAINNPAGKVNSATAGPSELSDSVANDAVEQLLQRATAAAQVGQNATAIEALSQAIGLNPGDSRLFRRRGDVYAAIGENANARADYSLAIQTDPGNAELYNLRGYFLMTHGAAAASVADFDKAVELNPQLAQAWNNRGLVFLADKKYKDAEGQFAKAIELDKKYSDAWNNRGYARMKQERWEEALADLKQAVTVNPEYSTAWNNSGLLYMRTEEYDKAAKAFTQAIRLSPLDARWVSHRRAAYLKMEKFEEASVDAQRMQWIQDLGKLTQNANARSGDPAAWIERGDHLAKGDQAAAAVHDYSRALALAPGNTKALNGRALAYLQANEYQKAIADCDESVIAESSAEAHSIRGDAWFALKQFDRAIQDFEAARRFDSVVAEAYRQRAAEHKAAGRTSEAQADLKQAAEIRNGLEGRLAPTDEKQPLPFPEQ